MFRLMCRYTQARLQAYIDRELSQHERRLVGRHIDTCDRCQTAFTRQRTIRDDLQRVIPRVGQLQSAQLDGMWSAIAGQLDQPDVNAESQREMRGLQYGLMLMAALVFLVTPLNFMQVETTATLPEHPSPVVDLTTPTPALATPRLHPTAIALVRTEPVDVDGQNLLNNTPAPATPGQ